MNLNKSSIVDAKSSQNKNFTNKEIVAKAKGFTNKKIVAEGRGSKQKPSLTRRWWPRAIAKAKHFT
ncbi:hypothetical protein OC709_02495, partial ['Planchonia careya' phytoplasma]